jgi:flagellar assembly protein FliH
MRMTAPTKFMFDSDFGDGPRKPAEPMITLAEHAVKLAETETASHKRGYVQGQNDAQVEVNRRIAATLDTIAKSIATASAALQAVEARLECEAVDVAVAVARKLAPTLIAREPFAEISALASDCFRQLISAPHIVVRVNDAIYATAKEQLEDIARGCSFEGRLVVLAESDIATGDCRIEWADGGINRDIVGADAAIAEAVTGYIGARRGLAGVAPEIRRRPPQLQPVPIDTAETQATQEQQVEEQVEQHVAPPSVPEQPELPLPRGHELLMPSDNEFRRP